MALAIEEIQKQHANYKADTRALEESLYCEKITVVALEALATASVIFFISSPLYMELPSWGIWPILGGNVVVGLAAAYINSSINAKELAHKEKQKEIVYHYVRWGLENPPVNEIFSLNGLEVTDPRTRFVSQLPILEEAHAFEKAVTNKQFANKADSLAAHFSRFLSPDVPDKAESSKREQFNFYNSKCDIPINFDDAVQMIRKQRKEITDPEAFAVEKMKEVYTKQTIYNNCRTILKKDEEIRKLDKEYKGPLIQLSIAVTCVAIVIIASIALSASEGWLYSLREAMTDQGLIVTIVPASVIGMALLIKGSYNLYQNCFSLSQDFHKRFGELSQVSEQIIPFYVELLRATATYNRLRGALAAEQTRALPFESHAIDELKPLERQIQSKIKQYDDDLIMYNYLATILHIITGLAITMMAALLISPGNEAWVNLGLLATAFVIEKVASYLKKKSAHYEEEILVERLREKLILNPELADMRHQPRTPAFEKIRKMTAIADLKGIFKRFPLLHWNELLARAIINPLDEEGRFIQQTVS